MAIRSLRRAVPLGLMIGFCLTLPACERLSGTATPHTPAEEGTVSAKAADIGPPLYPPAAMPELPIPQPLPEPIVIDPAVIQYDLKVQVPAQVDGMIELIATPVEGPVDPKDKLIVYHPRDLEKKQPYRQLRENDRVTLGQTLCRLDERNVMAQIEMSTRLIESCDKAIVEGAKALESYRRVRDITEELAKRPGKPVTELEIENLRATVARLAQDLAQNEQTKVKSAGEEMLARVQLTRYFIKSPVNGRIVKLLKSPGEFAKAGDIIMEIQSTDRIRLEGKLDAQYATRLRKGMPAYIVPTIPLGPAPYANWHRQEVTSVAVTAHPGRPMIVSGGMDATALVWDAFRTRKSYRLPNPVGISVRSVATTGRGAPQQLVASGGEDGKVRIWDLSNPDDPPREPRTILDDGHTSAVTALAFSSDGRFLASAAGRDVFLWDVAAGLKKYALPAEFRDAVTDVRFTPQATLLTVARDRTIRVWKLGERGAMQAEPLIDHRHGSVDILGVSSDGSRILFDKDGSRLDLVSLANGQTLGTLENTSGTMRFSGLAILSPDDRYILTTAGNADARGELQLWDMPPIGGRGSERRRLVTPNRATVTCAAFTSDPAVPFVVVGTQYGGVHYWTPPRADEPRNSFQGMIESWLPADARSVQVRVLLEHPSSEAGEILQDRGLATIMIPPDGDTQPEPPPIAVPAPVKSQDAAGPGAGVRNPEKATMIQPATAASEKTTAVPSPVPMNEGSRVPGVPALPPTPGSPANPGLPVPASPSLPATQPAAPQAIPILPSPVR
jgi:WD40 repeat protein